MSLQENNALAQLDLRAKTVTRIVALGSSDHSQPGSGIDASDKDSAVNIRNWPVKGLYMPDGIANYRVGGQRYVLTANEGDGRDWPGIVPGGDEETRRAKDVVDLSLFPDAADNAKLGRLNVTPLFPATKNAGGKLTSLYSLGSRSFSVRAADGTLVWDSGDAFECITALRHLEPHNLTTGGHLGVAAYLLRASRRESGRWPGAQWQGVLPRSVKLLPGSETKRQS